MVNLKLLRIVYNELDNDFCSIRYLSDKTMYSKNHIWNLIRVLKAMSIVEEKFSATKANVRVYKIKLNLCLSFDKFLQLYTEKL